ncbi:MAG TPA: multiheme c-type cytochrome [Kofleriaceae bacterium]|nr:multiheme c-type cytochrome [Kofleriaceae bacterium]
MKLVALVLIVAACKGDETTSPVRAVAVKPSDARPVDADPRPVVVKPSTRCAECHGKMADEWGGSMHAQSNKSKLYLSLSAADEQCAMCHAPLVAIAGADHPAAREGVTCDVCHTISKVDTDAPPPRFTLGVFDMIKYGPLCDAKDHYFHRMGCSKLHESAELCGGCHQRVVPGPDGSVPLYTTYQEWKEGPYPDEGWQCQDCHMPGVKAVVAEGEKVRANVPDHGFFGGGDLRKDAAKLELASRELDGGRVIDARLTNYAGHDLPSGFPGKRAVLRAVALDRAGKELAKDEISIGRKLVDVRGAPTAYANAARVQADDRLKPKEVRAVTLFSGQAIAGAAKVKADFVWQSIDPALAGPLGVAVDEKPIAHAEMKIK